MKWNNMLLTDSGFYNGNELDKPLHTLINRFSKMLDKPFSEAKILFIPTAAMPDKAFADRMTKRLRDELLQMGILPENITIHDIDGLLSENEAMSHDVIYFTGGNTPYLAKRVFEFGFDKIIKKMVFANKVYIGMSAGSMLAMPNFNVDNLPEHNREFTGLGLINAYFTVHCKLGTPSRADFPLPHISLTENQALAVGSDGYELIDGLSSAKFLFHIGDYETRIITKANCEQVMDVYNSNQDFFVLTEGKSATLSGCIANIDAMPPGFDPQNKHCISFWENDKCIAVLDFLVGYPSPDCLYIGLLLIHGNLHGKGVGKKIIKSILSTAKCHGLKTARVAVNMANTNAATFWGKLGFIKTAESKATVGDIEMDVNIMEASCTQYPQN